MPLTAGEMNEQTQTQPGEIMAGEKRVRVLVVDDSFIARCTVCSLLETQNGIEIVGCAPDGREALRLAESLVPDLVLMDLSMPIMNGLEATQLLRQKIPATRIVIVTSHDSPEFRRTCRVAGAHGFITKNRLHAELPDLINQLFPNPAASQ